MGRHDYFCGEVRPCGNLDEPGGPYRTDDGKCSACGGPALRQRTPAEEERFDRWIAPLLQWALADK